MSAQDDPDLETRLLRRERFQRRSQRLQRWAEERRQLDAQRAKSHGSQDAVAAALARALARKAAISGGDGGSGR